jgi:hypothetical protein
MRKLMWVATLLSLPALGIGSDAAAGQLGSLNVQDGHVLIAEAGLGVDAVSTSQVLNGVWSWFFVIDDTSVSVTDPTVTVDSGYPVSAFPGLGGATSFPVSASQTGSLNAGESFFPNLNFVSNIPVSMSPGFDSSRSLSPQTIPVGGGHQQLTVTITPRTTLGGYKVAIYNSLPGVSVTQVSGPVDWNNLQAGATYTIVYDLTVPNPFGVPFAYEPNVHVNGEVSSSQTCCAGPSNAVSFADSTLDDGIFERGQITYSVAQTVDSWSIENGSFLEISYQGLLLLAPTSQGQCHDGGWRQYDMFKNQGDCVSYVATNGTNQPG